MPTLFKEQADPVARTLDRVLPGDAPRIGRSRQCAALRGLIFSQGKESTQLNNQKDIGYWLSAVIKVKPK